MHLVSVNRGQRLIGVTVSGTVTHAVVEAVARDLHAAIHRFDGAPGTHLTLYDLSAVEVVPAPIIEQFRSFFVDPRYAGIWARKVALVTRSALFTLQLKRVQRDRPNIRTFPDRAAALGWLLAS